MSPPLLARLQHQYHGFQLAVDLQLPASGISAFFGASGSGKTTLLRCIAGLQQATQGYVEVNGQIWQDSQQKLFLPPHRRALGYVFQEANLFPHLNVGDNLRYGLKRVSQPLSSLDWQQLLDLLGIAHLLDRYPLHLSGGERQRVAIARALATQPQILLMDEPLASLDYARKQEILPFLLKLHQQLKIPLLYVTHDPHEVARLADYVVILRDGQVVAAGSLSETLRHLQLAVGTEPLLTSVWNGVVTAQDGENYLTEVDCAAGRLSLPQIDAAINDIVRVQIEARNVSISLEKPPASSILNVLPAKITALTEMQNGQMNVQLHLNNELLLAQITCKSAYYLNLHSNRNVYVQIKASSLSI
jgi:molybdate transport system ATP-binding protein